MCVRSFTETDRIIMTLLTQSRHKGNEDGHGQGCIDGRMVLLRVYDNDESLSLQRVMRSALDVLGLVHRDEKGDEKVRAFSVVSDTEGTTLHKDIEACMRRFDLRKARSPDATHLFDPNGSPLPLDDISSGCVYSKHTLDGILSERESKIKDWIKSQASRSEGTKTISKLAGKAALSYGDLYNLPILVIVTMKCRMGDTLPHSLKCLDLRLRTTSVLSSFSQELGRICRYPRLMKRRPRGLPPLTLCQNELSQGESTTDISCPCTLVDQ